MARWAAALTRGSFAPEPVSRMKKVCVMGTKPGDCFTLEGHGIRGREGVGGDWAMAPAAALRIATSSLRIETRVSWGNQEQRCIIAIRA
jgi:uncharacterized repeat protein (TIGR04076 family)